MSVPARITNPLQNGPDAATPTLEPHVQVSLGMALREVYASTCLTEALPDEQVELLLRLRHKERDRRRAG
jgi:hypothetical protein